MVASRYGRDMARPIGPRSQGDDTRRDRHVSRRLGLWHGRRVRLRVVFFCRVLPAIRCVMRVGERPDGSPAVREAPRGGLDGRTTAADDHSYAAWFRSALTRRIATIPCRAAVRLGHAGDLEPQIWLPTILSLMCKGASPAPTRAVRHNGIMVWSFGGISAIGIGLSPTRSAAPDNRFYSIGSVVFA